MNWWWIDWCPVVYVTWYEVRFSLNLDGGIRKYKTDFHIHHVHFEYKVMAYGVRTCYFPERDEQSSQTLCHSFHSSYFYLNRLLVQKELPLVQARWLLCTTGQFLFLSKSSEAFCWLLPKVCKKKNWHHFHAINQSTEEEWIVHLNNSTWRSK